MFNSTLIFIGGTAVGFIFAAVGLLIWGRRVNARAAEICPEILDASKCPHEFKKTKVFSGEVAVCQVCGVTLIRGLEYFGTDADKLKLNEILRALSAPLFVA